MNTLNQTPAYTSHHEGFPQYSRQLITGYMAAPAPEKYGDLCGLFLDKSHGRAQQDGSTLYRATTRLCPDMGEFAWGDDYCMFHEQAVYRAGESEDAYEYGYSFTGTTNGERSDFLFYRMNIDGIVDWKFSGDPRERMLLKWLTYNVERKVTGEKP